MPQEIPTIAHNGSNYDFHVVLKHLAEGFEGSNFSCLGEFEIYAGLTIKSCR